MRSSIASSFLLTAAAILAKRTNASHTREPFAPIRELRDDDTPQQFDVVIVGAGWAGIKAAKELLDSGVSSILVLEANDYVGGRSKSINSDDSINAPILAGNVSNVPVDLGSEWQYVSGNDMEDYLRDNGFFDGVDFDNDRDDFMQLDYAQFYMQSIDVNGTINTDAIEDEEANELRERIWGEFLSWRKKQSDKKDDQSYSSK
mmetsp:Transcript_427/g.944  ORF Transcript_427/g.944 Transcript_427/m.944 type:complete len:203 (-) Transcript_427:1258-1866(-)